MGHRRDQWCAHAQRRRARRSSRRRAWRLPGAGSQSGGLRRWRQRLLDWSLLPWVRGAVIGLAVWTFLVGASSLDFFGYRGEPVETAVVLSVGVSETELIACGRSSLPNSPATTVTYESLTPRDGYPPRFSMTTCPDPDDEVGDRLPVVRTGVGDDYVFPDPIVTVTQLLKWPLPAACVAAVVATLAFVVREEWGATRYATRRREAQGRAQAEEASVEGAIRRAEARRRAEQQRQNRCGE